VFITQHGRASAVLVSVGTYERTQRELEVFRLLAQAETDIEAGVGVDLDVVMAEAAELLDRP
jgi:PHD/YefM family antitoxin component YafN of YafNO toxin-antitoxin module